MVNLDTFSTPITPIEEDELIKRINKSLTDGDLRRYLGGSVGDNIIKYSDLVNYNSITELLPKQKDYKIILIENDDFNKGHWVAIMRYFDKQNDDKDTIEYFNSYGKKPDAQKSVIGACRYPVLGQTENYLSQLIKKRPKDLTYIWNKKAFQKQKQGINTCGRWLVLRLTLMRDMDMGLKEFQSVIKMNAKKTGLPLDALVSVYIS